MLGEEDSHRPHAAEQEERRLPVDVLDDPWRGLERQRRTWKRDCKRVLDIQQGFQYGPYNSTGVFKRDLTFNRGFQRGLKGQGMGNLPAYDAAVTTPTHDDCRSAGTWRAMSEWIAGNATPSPKPIPIRTASKPLPSPHRSKWSCLMGHLVEQVYLAL